MCRQSTGPLSLSIMPLAFPHVVAAKLKDSQRRSWLGSKSIKADYLALPEIFML